MNTSNTSSAVMLTAKDATGIPHDFQLNADQGVFVGTSANCGWQLDGDDLAEIQCRLEFTEGELWIQSWLSAEGTRVNNLAIETPTKVGPSDSIQIGRYEIRINDSPSAGRSTSPTVDHASSVTHQASADDEPHDSLVTVNEHEPVLDEAPATDPSDTDEADFPSVEASFSGDSEPETIDFSADFFDLEEEQTFDRETVALLQAEIEDLQAQLAQRDAEVAGQGFDVDLTPRSPEQPDEILSRMQELIDEANRSDERVAILEEMLLAAENANRAEVEERQQLEGWVGDIEQRVGQREDEHAAELDALRARLEEANEKQDLLIRKLQHNVGEGTSRQLEEELDSLRNSNNELQEQLADSQRECRRLQQRAGEESTMGESELRAERAELAKERAQLSRMRFELTSKLSEIEHTPGELEIDSSANPADREAAHRIRTLREHLREIHEQEKHQECETGLTTRLKKLWKRVEY